ncbi:kinase-like protein [Serendipita vermifera]|nr:kinase-like protein [Serendipita vermifera]
MEANDIFHLLSRPSPMATTPELQSRIDPWFYGASEADLARYPSGPSFVEILEPPSPFEEAFTLWPLSQESRHQDTQHIRNQGIEAQVPHPTQSISVTPANTQPQHHPRQPNSPLQNSILNNPGVNTPSRNETGAHLGDKVKDRRARRSSQGSTNPYTNIDPGISRQFRNLTTGISTTSPIAQRPSISQPPPSNVVQNLQQSRQNLTHYEQALVQVRQQVNQVASSRNIQQLQTIRASLAETQKKCQMEREKWAQVLANARTQQRDGLDNFIKAIEETVGRATQLCSQYESFGERLEGALQTLQPEQRPLQEHRSQSQKGILQADSLPEMVPSPSDSSPFELSGLVRKLEKRPFFDGVYSRVYIGECRRMKVAIKEIRGVTTNRVTERKFRRELQTWWRLRHANILPLLGYIHEDDTNEIYRALVSPWMENGSAAQYIRRDLTPAQRLSLFGDVINGLQYLHNFQPVVVHADLKPLNVLIGENGIGQICDFGLVRLLQEDMPTGTTTSSPHTGTTRYLAYELVTTNGNAIPTTTSDIYALGCLGMEFIYRRPPHHDIGENTFAIQQRINGKYYPSELPTDGAGELTFIGTLFDSCWAVKPAARPNINEIHTWFWGNYEDILSGL